RLMKWVIATRAASIWRSVNQQGSSAFKPNSPNATSPPRHALPRMRPRCCLRYLTFFGINIACLSPGARGSPRRALPIVLLATSQRHEPLALVQPDLDADLTVGRVGLREAVVDVGAQRLQRQLTVQVPLRACDLGSVQPPGDPDLDPA